jgi:hypothetical protein
MNILYAKMCQLSNMLVILLTLCLLNLKIVHLSDLMLEITIVESLKSLNHKPLTFQRSNLISCQSDIVFTTTTRQDYLSKYKEFLAVEGGLSSDPYDRYNSKPKYHTNKGVRYSTFKAILKKGTYKEFLAMEDSTYLKIIVYHDKVVSSSSKDSLSIPVKLFLIEELWACGSIQRYKGITDLDRLYTLKEQRYKQLFIKKPKLLRYKKGWETRRKEFKIFNSQF